MAKLVAAGRSKARRKREIAHCINVVFVTIVVLAVTFSTFITVLYFQKVQRLLCPASKVCAGTVQLRADDGNDG